MTVAGFLLLRLRCSRHPSSLALRSLGEEARYCSAVMMVHSLSVRRLLCQATRWRSWMEQLA
jgi:hypothetical protein